MPPIRAHVKPKNQLAPWRKAFQWLISLLILLIPWVRINGASLFRIDIPSLSLHLFGATLRIEELYLLLFFSLSLVLFFLLATLIFGRIWCGWACPQTTLSDLAEWLARRVNLKFSGLRVHGKRGNKILWHLALLLLALLVGSNLLWYFTKPEDFFRQLFSGQLHPAAVLTLVSMTVLTYFDLALLRRLFCRDICPYGRFQTVLVDSATLALQLPAAEASRCINCGACVSICPMEIDIRQGYQIECINCGRCRDACRQVMSKHHQPGLIGYYFGIQGKNWRALLNPRTLMLGLAFGTITTLLIVAIQMRAAATLTVTMSHQVPSRRLADGSTASFFNAWLNNHTTAEVSYDLSARAKITGEKLTLKGPTQGIILKGGENRKVDFVLITFDHGKESRIGFLISDPSGRPLADAEALITPNQSR
jgi:cytochrome c oxidase accessory protein FixG